MALETIGLMTPGDMGQAVAMQLKGAGFDVRTALDGRSERSRTLAREAGLADVGSIHRLVAECDVVLSVMNPGAARDFAGQVADALRVSGRKPLIVECNAIAPDTVREIGVQIEAAGGRFLDAGIIGPPPRGAAKSNLYVSGPRAGDLGVLATPQLAVHVVSERIGDASALKMCYAALNKGTQALWLEVLIAAKRLGVEELLDRQLEASQAERYHGVLAQFPGLPPKAYRWVPEMHEIARMLGSHGVTAKVFEGIADVNRFIAGTALGHETPEGRDRSRDGKAVIRLLAAARDADPS